MEKGASRGSLAAVLKKGGGVMGVGSLWSWLLCLKVFEKEMFVQLSSLLSCSSLTRSPHLRVSFPQDVQMSGS